MEDRKSQSGLLIQKQRLLSCQTVSDGWVLEKSCECLRGFLCLDELYLAFDSSALDWLHSADRHWVTSVADSETGLTLAVCLPTLILSTCLYANKASVRWFSLQYRDSRGTFWTLHTAVIVLLCVNTLRQSHLSSGVIHYSQSIPDWRQAAKEKGEAGFANAQSAEGAEL